MDLTDLARYSAEEVSHWATLVLESDSVTLTDIDGEDLLGFDLHDLDCLKLPADCVILLAGALFRLRGTTSLSNSVITS
jgi:hypothetical protein